MLRTWATQKDALHSISRLAATGKFDRALLDRYVSYLVESKLADCKPLVYYLASLYLQLNHHGAATDLLASVGVASSDMKWFAAVMIHAMTYSLALPKLTQRERLCLVFLQQHLLTSEQSMARLVSDCDQVAVVGNAPGQRFVGFPDNTCSFYFNNYARNPRIVGEPLVHVVTPSWKVIRPLSGQHLCITGNSIFHRRSKVWRRFLDRPAYSGIHTLPQPLWRDLHTELQAPPSAGATVLCYLARYANLNGKRICVGGFSEDAAGVNHSYDRVPLSARHNWSRESILRGGWLKSIRDGGADLVLLD